MLQVSQAVSIQLFLCILECRIKKNAGWKRQDAQFKTICIKNL